MSEIVSIISSAGGGIALSCLFCNSKTESKRKSKRINTEVVGVISKLWGVAFSESEETLFYKELVTCLECNKKLRQISTLLQQLDTFRLLIVKLKFDIENNIKSTLSKENSSLTHTIPLIKLRSKILQNSKNIKSQKITQAQHQIIKSGKDVPDSKVDSKRDDESSETSLADSGGNDDTSNSEKVECVQAHLDSDLIFQNSEKSQSEEEGCCIIINRLKCPESGCRFTFKDELGKEAHLRKYHQGEPYPYRCKTCDKLFRTRRQLKIHIMGHQMEAPFICEHCSKGFKTEQQLQCHSKTIHSKGGLEFKCKYCIKNFINKTKLKNHEITHTKQYPVTCFKCDKGFVNKSALKIHMAKHEVNPIWQCNKCGKTFSTNKSLESHNSLHTGNHPYPCSVQECSWGGPSQSALNKHMFKHSELNNFECSVCNKKFKYPNTLKKHMKIHENRKNFRCILCDKAFIDNYKLLRHMQIHEGNRPFDCLVCKKQFYTKDALKVHTKVHGTKGTDPTKNNSKRKNTHSLNEIGNPSAEEFCESQEIPVPQEFGTCELIPVNPVNESKIESNIMTSSFLTELISSPDIFSGQMFQFNYS